MIRIKLRRDTASKWTAVDPVLGDGEPGYEKDTGKIKIGNGIAPWTMLPYINLGEPVVIPDGPITDAVLLAHINSLEPHPVYDDGPSLLLLYQNAKV